MRSTNDGACERSAASPGAPFALRKLFLLPPLAAAIIAALVAWKLTRPSVPDAVPGLITHVGRPAPLFELYDENSRLVRLARYVGRHKLLIIFFDGRLGPDRNGLLLALRRDFATIHETGAIVLAISALRPAEHRAPPGTRGERTERDDPFPFPMLSDINDYAVHRLYGAYDDAAQMPREAVFVVDRARIIRHAHIARDDLGAPRLWAAELRNVK